MFEFHELITEVMDLAQDFSPRINFAMLRRKAILKEMAKISRNWLEASQPDLVVKLKLDAEDCAQADGVSPVAWVRVYSKTRSPSATAGFYVIYLFDAIGQKVFLSLNQGTSEFRTGQWRPIRDRRKVVDSATAARFTLEQCGADITWGSTRPISLAMQTIRDRGLVKSSDPVDRARNYEFGNILAKTYERNSMPSDAQLREDLLDFVSSLVVLYDSNEKFAVGPAAGNGERRGLGRLSALERRAVERQAIEISTRYYEENGWAVKDVSAFRPYDLECSRNGQVLHVEVKGTTTSDLKQIELTRNEVDHCQSYPYIELTLVVDVRLETNSAGLPIGAGGVLSRVIPWRVEDQRLAPLTYLYHLPNERVAS